MGRYDDVPTAELQVTTADGSRRFVRHYRRRAIPAPSRHVPLAVHLVLPKDRLDLVSHRYTRDPLGFWRIADANAALDPDDLVDAEAVGTEIVVPAPGLEQP